jgi:hypothetical protein
MTKSPDRQALELARIEAVLDRFVRFVLRHSEDKMTVLVETRRLAHMITGRLP